MDERQSDLPPIYPAVRVVLGSEASRTFPLKDDAQNVIAPRHADDHDASARTRARGEPTKNLYRPFLMYVF